MNDDKMKNVASSPEEFRAWLVERVAYYVERSSEDIRLDMSAAESGLDSVYAFMLCSEIEDDLGLSVDPITVWELGTLEALVAHLTGLASG
jgi:acyl carrier protein